MCIFIFVLRSTRTENALLHTVCLIERMRHIEGYACLPKIFAICLNRVKLSCTKCFIKCPYCQRWCLCNNQNNQNSANAGRWNYSEDGCWKDLFSVYMRWGLGGSTDRGVPIACMPLQGMLNSTYILWRDSATHCKTIYRCHLWPVPLMQDNAHSHTERICISRNNSNWTRLGYSYIWVSHRPNFTQNVRILFQVLLKGRPYPWPWQLEGCPDIVKHASVQSWLLEID